MVEKKEITPEMRLSEKEIDLIHNAFKDNDKLLKTIRKSMWQMELTEDEKRELNELVKGDEMKKVLRKIFLPELTGEEPFFNQVIDLWLSLEVNHLFPDDAKNFMLSRKKTIDFLKQELDVLCGEETERKECFNFTLSEDNIKNYINLISRNETIKHIEKCLIQLYAFGASNKETPEEMMKRISKDSSK